MNKDNLNRLFGNPERQKPITPHELLAAAHLIRDYCKSVTPIKCHKCIFHDPFYGCHLSEGLPGDWNLSDAKRLALDYIKNSITG